jgi:hypothetical protein
MSIREAIRLLQFPDAIQPLGTTLHRDPCAHLPRPGAAADWLSQAFGFTVRLRIANHRIQMKAGDGCFTIAEGTMTPNSSHIIQVRIENAEGHCERARQNGAIILTEPQDQPTASANTTLRTFVAIAGTSPKLSPTSLRRNGAAVRFVLSESSPIRLERCRGTSTRSGRSPTFTTGPSRRASTVIRPGPTGVVVGQFEIPAVRTASE